jgi:glycosyltransferase involved in cell wall biosynthesis
LIWDCSGAQTTVITHGVIDPGLRYSGAINRGCVVINEPVRRNRAVGLDLLPILGVAVPLDLFGMKTEPIGGYGNLTQDQLHNAMAQRRVYVHPYRWTSLGLSLIEAMLLGMPVVAVATTGTTEAIPEAAGIISCDLGKLAQGLRELNEEPEMARTMGLAAREQALERFGLQRFLAEWDQLLEEVTS